MKKIEFDGATIEAAYMGWIDAQEFTPKFFARFYADAANRQLEAMEKRGAEKPAFEVGKRYRDASGFISLIVHGVPRPPYSILGLRQGYGYINPYAYKANGECEHGYAHNLLPGAIEESGQAGVSPPLVEGGSPALTDEELGRELLASIGMIPAQVLQQELAVLGRCARELLTPQFAEQIADATRRLGDDVAHCKERARKAEQVLNSLRREGEHHMRSVDESDDPYDKGLRQGMLIALYAAGFTIIPAQPLKVIRND